MNEQPTMLIVEDSAQDEFLIMRALGRVSLARHVQVVHDGQQALDYLFQEGEFGGPHAHARPAVVVLDINLPRVNGLDVLRALRAAPRTRVLPIVMLTSSDEERDLITSYACGANGFVRKPLEPAELAETVARLGFYWLVVNQPPPERPTHG
jgi:two-component system response regulator